MSKPEMVRLDDEAAQLLVEIVDELPGNPELKSITSEAIKDYHQNTYQPLVRGDSQY